MPNTSTPSIIREVAIGRRIKGSEMLIGDRLPTEMYRERGWKVRRGSARRARLWRRGLYSDALGQATLPVDDDPLAWRQPLGDDGDAVLNRSDVDGASLDSVIRLDNIGVIAIRAVLDGLRGHRRDFPPGREDYAQADELAGPQPFVIIVKARLEVNRASRLVNGVAVKCQLAFGELLLAVPAVGIDDQRRTLMVLPHVVERLLRQCEAHKDRLHLRDRDKRRVVVRMHEIALVDEFRAEAPVDWRANIAIAEIEFGGIDLRLITLDRSLQLSDRCLLLVVALPGLPPRADQLFITVEIQLGADELRLVFLLIGLRLLKRRLKRARVNLEERLALLDILALLEIDLDDLSVDPALDRDHVVGLDRAEAVEENRATWAGVRPRRDRASRRRRLCLRRWHLSAVVQSPQHDDCHQRKDYDCSDRTPYHSERLRTQAPMWARYLS